MIRIFVQVLDLPHPHPDDPDFIEPQPEWFSRPTGFGGSRDRSDTGSSGATTLTTAERALSEFTEEVPRVGPRGPPSDRSEESDSASGHNWTGPDRRGREYAVSERSVERSVAEFFEDVPTVQRTVTSSSSSRTVHHRGGGPRTMRGGGLGQAVLHETDDDDVASEL